MLNQIEKKTATRLDTYIFYQTLHSLNLHNYKNGFLRHLCNDELTFLNCISSAALGYLQKPNQKYSPTLWTSIYTSATVS
jgi:hypothetical protein